MGNHTHTKICIQLGQQNVARFFHLPFTLVVNPNIYIIILDSQLLIQGDQNIYIIILDSQLLIQGDQNTTYEFLGKFFMPWASILVGQNGTKGKKRKKRK